MDSLVKITERGPWSYSPHSTIPHEEDGKLANAVVTGMIRRFESTWEEAFTAGEDPSLIPVPTFKIADLVKIIRHYPVIKQPDRFGQQSFL